jgi:hypothetical protein
MKTAHLPGMACLVLGCIAVSAAAADWKPADGPLKTRWAKDVSPTNALPEYPRPQMVRKQWMNLNGLWDYAITPKDAAAAPGKYDGQILVPYPVESALSGVMKRVGEANRLWYRRTFTLPADYAGKRILLHFGAVDWEASVRVNGKDVGSHRGGYDPFTFDITDAIKPSGDQEIAVSVWDPTNSGPQPRGKQVNRPGGIFYTPVTGIWQTVWIEAVPQSYIASLKITPDVDGALVRVSADVRGAKPNYTLQVTVYDPSLPPTATQQKKLGQPISAVSGGRLDETHAVALKNAHLWSPDAPFLYSLLVEVYDGPQLVDEVESYFAMRKISLGRDDKGITRICLNTQPIFQMGPLDQGFWPDGIYTAPTDEALRSDIEITKKLGFNMTRKHVKVEPDRWYYWCDKLGLLVWQDMPSGDRSVRPGGGEIKKDAEAGKEFEAELKALIDTHYNHPCIVQWVVFNEGWGQYDTARLVSWVKDYDKSRLADCASGWNDVAGIGDVHDMHHYPNPDMPPVEDGRAVVLGEYGGLGLPTEGHMWENRSWGYQGMAGTAQLTSKYIAFARKLAQLKDKGLCAAVYTQITDVETEANGLLTYDRAVIKPDLEKIAAANHFQLPPAPEMVEIVPTARTAAQMWRYTTEKPAANDWSKPEFDDSSWKEGKSGFGTEGTPGAIIGTEWNSADIWIRRTFTLEDRPLKMPQLSVHHDEDIEVYLNGVLALRRPAFITAYDTFDIRPEALKTLKPGKNALAVHCHQTTGGQYVDVGIVDEK